MRREEPHPAQLKRTAADALEHRGKAPGGSSRGDATVGRALREVQHLGAVAEHRRARLPEVQLASVDLAQVRQQLRFQQSIATDELLQCANQAGIGDLRQRAKVGGGLHFGPLLVRDE